MKVVAFSNYSFYLFIYIYIQKGAKLLTWRKNLRLKITFLSLTTHWKRWKTKWKETKLNTCVNLVKKIFLLADRKWWSWQIILISIELLFFPLVKKTDYIFHFNWHRVYFPFSFSFFFSSFIFLLSNIMTTKCNIQMASNCRYVYIYIYKIYDNAVNKLT